MLKRKKRIIAKVMATTMLATTLASTFAVEANAQEPRASVTSSKISGDDRYKTAVEISKNYSSTSKHAVVVNGQKGIVDALTATPYASLKKAPILMTQNNKLNEDTKKELTRRGIKTVDIIGGTASVSDSVKAEIEKMGITVNRIAGNSKYETSLKVAKEVDKISNISKIAVANGEVLADAVSVAAPAAQNKMPIILAHPSKGLDDATKTYIKGEGISTSYVIGGTSSVSNTTQNSLPGTKKRLEGTGRQETNAKVVKEFYDTTSHDNIYVTKSGQVNKADEIADALAVGVLAAHNQDPVLIVGKNLAGEQKTLLEGKDFDKITEVGNGIPTASIQAIKDTQSSVKNVTTVAALNSALSNAKDGDVINFKPSSTVSESITLSTSKNVTVNLDGTHSGNVTVNMANGNVNINGNITGKVSVDAVKTINIKSGVTVKHLEIKSSANKANIVNKGTVTTFDVLASGVVISGSGNITALNPQGDTDYSGVTGEIGNLDTSKPVSQVVAQNAKELVIRFSKAIDKSTVVGSNGKLKDTINITSNPGDNSGRKITRNECNASLSGNGMTLTITPQREEYFEGRYTLVLDRITSNSNKLDRYTTTFIADDNTSPEVTGITFNQDTNKFEISLSEPIDSITGLVLRLNNVSYESKILEPTQPTKKLELDRNAKIDLGENIDVYMAGIKDSSGNLMKPYTGKITANKQDLTISSVKQVANNKIRILFNKKLTYAPDKSTIAPGSTTNEGTKGIKVYKSTTAPNNTNMITNIDPVDSDTTGRSYDITINHDFGTTTSQRVYVALDAEACTDNTGVKNKAYSTSITLNNDKTKPTMASAKLSVNKDAIEVTVSESIKDSIDSGKVSIRKNSVPVDGITAKLKDGTENVIVVKTSDREHGIDANGMLQGGRYQVYFGAGAFEDLSGNKVDAFNTDNITVTAPPTVEEPASLNIEQNKAEGGTLVENEYRITVRNEDGLSENDKIFKDASLSTKNFTVDGKAIPTNSNVRFSDHTYNEILIALPKEYVEFSGKAMLKVKDLEVKSGKKLNGAEVTVDVVDNKAPTLEKVEFITVKDKDVANKPIKGYEFKLTFDENVELDSKGETIESLLNDVEIKTGSTKYDGFKLDGQSKVYDSAIYEANGKVVTIKIDKNGIKNTENWDKVFGTNSSTTFEIIDDMDIVRDSDSIIEDNDKRLKAKKGIKVYLQKKTEER